MASVDEIENIDALNEVCLRTPGYFGIQQEVWLSHCQDLCSFIGYANPNLVKPILDELHKDIDDLGLNVDEVIDSLKNEELDGYVFKCQNCGKHRIHLDD